MDASGSSPTKNNIGESNKSLDQSNGEKSVRFSSVDVRDYSICLGDNPSVSRGVAISLGWGYDKEITFEINSYECNRSGYRRHFEELKIPSLQRIQLLKGLGYSRGELNEQRKKTHLDKQHRFRTRRRIALEDRFKAFFRCNCIVNTFQNVLAASGAKKSEKMCLRKIEPEEDTLGPSMSSTISVIRATEDC